MTEPGTDNDESICRKVASGSYETITGGVRSSLPWKLAYRLVFFIVASVLLAMVLLGVYDYVSEQLVQKEKVVRCSF
jgi:hypothetical protein